MDTKQIAQLGGDRRDVRSGSSQAKPARAKVGVANASQTAVRRRPSSAPVPVMNVPVLRSIPQRSAFRMVLSLLIVLAVLLLAKLFWSIFAPLPYPQTAPTIVPVAKAVSDPADTITARNPFAIAGAPIAAFVNDDAQLQETTLDLTLHGVTLNGDKSSAIIDVKNGQGQDSFRIGEELADGVKLVEVRLEEVVISRAGTREVLRLKSDEPNASRRHTTTRAPARLEPGRPATTSVAEAKTQNLEIDDNDGAGSFDIQEVVQFRIRQTDKGAPGIFIFPGRNSVAFAEAGLVAQDLLVTVNGAPPPQDLRRLYDFVRQVSQSGSLSLVIERDGVPRPVNIDFQRLVNQRDSDDPGDITGDEVKL